MLSEQFLKKHVSFFRQTNSGELQKKAYLIW